MSYRLLVSVGSDSHPFDRIVDSVDAWLDQGVQDVEAVLQHGTSSPPQHPDRWQRASQYLDFHELQGYLARADIVVTQGGPTGIEEARRLGRQPIVMPRTPERGEHVDGHQVAFCRHLAATGAILLAESPDQLWRLLDGVVSAPSSVRFTPSADPTIGRTVERFEELTHGLSVRRRPWRRRGPS